MATNFSVLLQPSNSTDALFRAWGLFIHDTFVTTGGWINTSDTGQIDFTTVVKPAGVSTKSGYKIYRMNDTLQATSPVFIRIDFGSASGSANNPGFWLTIGTGSNGTGTITGILFDGGAVATPTVSSNSTSATASNSYGSADTNRISLGLFIQTTARALVLNLERSKDVNGDDTGSGLILAWNNNITIINNSRYLILAGGTQPPVQGGLQYILDISNPSAFGSDVGIAIPIPLRGVAQQPGYGIVVVRTNDFVAEASFSMTLYGNTVTYQHLNSIQTGPAVVGGTDPTSKVCIRFD